MNVTALVEQILLESSERLVPTASAYPEQYAAWFVFAHPAYFAGQVPEAEDMTREVAVAAIERYAATTGQDVDAVMVALADGYLRENNYLPVRAAWVTSVRSAA